VLRLTDTQTKTVREVVPATPGLLRIYACGPTVYRDAHVGNLRSFMLADLIRRAAELRGLRVQLVQNITDVGHLVDDSAVDSTGEDKLLTQARLEDKSPFVIARFYEEAFHRDMAVLNNRPADAYPRASEWIDAMLELIGRLVERGHAYVGDDGTVYFDARSYDATAPCRATASRTCAPATGSMRRTSGRASGSTPTGRCGSAPAPAAR
jgi:cysteinyl-tRNA synthetase